MDVRQPGQLPLPVKVVDVTAEWLTAALRSRAPGATITSLEIVEIAHGTCTRLRLRLDRDAAARVAGIPSEVILKGGFEPHSHAMRSMHRAEALGYRDVMPVLHLRSPACFFADYDEERGQGIVVLEDLCRREVTFGDALQPQSFAQVARQLTELARFHAQTWQSMIFAPGGDWSWITDTMDVIEDYYAPMLRGEGWSHYAALPRMAAVPRRFADPGWLLEAMESLTDLSRNRPHCVLHGDTHLGNLYLEPDGKPGFFDTIPHFGPALWEVTYHIVCALDAPDRRAWERPLVDHYLQELRAAEIEVPDLDAAMEDFAAWLTRGLLIFLLNDPAFQSETVNTAYAARFAQAMLDHAAWGRI